MEYIKGVFSNIYVLSLLIAFLGEAIFILYFVLKGMRMKDKTEDVKENLKDNDKEK